jgi:pimeloyl-ACP methyl ester carboxylesterase
MIAPTERHFRGLSRSGFHRIRYFDWGDPRAAETVVCVHGLTRNAHDFDRLAERLASRYRVITVDIPGRGGSDWLRDPADYSYAQYQLDMTALIARLDVDRVHWIGTSMGGFLGMLLAAQAGTPLRSLLVNDVGPFIPKAALQRIADYVGLDNRFSSLAAVERHLRKVHAPFGPLTDSDWYEMARHGHRHLSDGSYALAYDPAIVNNVKERIADVDIWPVWDKVACPTLVLRGAESDLLKAETAQEMTERGPKARLVDLAGIGHAPALMSADQLDLVEDWLRQQA